MPEFQGEKIAQNQKKAAIEAFVGSLMSSSKMTGLYQPGHPAIMQISERLTGVLMKNLGQEPTLVLDVKGKTVSVGDMVLAETKDISLLGTTLHTLGIGQVLFTNRLAKEGMYEFMKILLEKADEQRTLTAIQQELQKLKIDGLQMSFVLSFVATGETEIVDQKPGQLREEQIAAFIKTETAEDFLTLLLRENEILSGKSAEAISALLDNVLLRVISLEQFQQSMPWDSYDPRIRACWESFMQRQEWEPKVEKGKRFSWSKKSLISQMGLFRNRDLESLQTRAMQDKSSAVHYALQTLHSVLDNSSSSAVQVELAMSAYGRLLSELGNDGNVKSLLAEFKMWQEPLPSGEERPQLRRVMQLIEGKVLSPALAENIVLYLNELEDQTPQFVDVGDFMTALGMKSVPLFIEELRKLADQKNRKKLAMLIGAVCIHFNNVQPLILALADPDWFVVRNIVVILGDVNYPGTAQSLRPLLDHNHQRVREETIRVLGKIADGAAIDVLINLIMKSDRLEEVEMAITTVSLLNLQGIDSKLIQAFNSLTTYNVRVAIIAALSRCITQTALSFLKGVAKKSLMERMTGRNKVLRNTARESAEQIEKMLKG